MKYLFPLLFLFYSLSAFPQEKKPDSTKNLKEVIVKASNFFQPDYSRGTGAVNLLTDSELKNQHKESFVSVLNTAPGVRMEERSPGSYRLSLRGSLLRSPFGIRNVKIYIDEFPLTDAGGNTYLNLIDAGSIRNMSIFKGPQASIFGANTGGAILINTSEYRNTAKEFGLTVGSYGLWHQTANVVQLLKSYSFSVNEGYQQSDGYRENSALKRKYFQTSQVWNYSQNGQLKVFVLYSDLEYETPGGLTEAQLVANPRSARPSTPTLPSAVTQQAAIYNRTFFGGLSNTYHFSKNYQFVVAVFGNHTDFKNPFITNYEKRKENTFGLRSFLNYHNAKNTNVVYDAYLGIENARTLTKINNFGNDKGTASVLQASDDLTAKQDFAFFRMNIDINNRFILELGSSLNLFGYSYKSYFPLMVEEQQHHFKAQLMPRIAVSYLLAPNFNIRSSISKGYSPPTIAEVRASDQIINNSLQAEAGWNYESGFNLHAFQRRLTVDGSLFYFNLKNAIVRRLTPADAEYFVNAGGTKQLGTEVQVSLVVLQPNSKRFFDGINLTSSYTYSHFRFDDFKNAAQDFTGNKLTGVPKNTIVSGLELIFTKDIYLFIQHNYTSTIPLNDANSIYSRKYHLADLKMGIKNLKLAKIKLDASFGINNIFNQQYSLGNDLNAANNRYYNAAPGVNYFTGLSVKF